MERRSYLRMPVDAPFFVRFTLAEGESVQSLLIDISRSGILCKLPKLSDEALFELGVPVYVSIGGLLQRPVAARVVRVYKEQIAAHFAQVLAFSSEELESIIQRL